MNRILEGFLDPQLMYQYGMGPERIPDRDTALRDGINCVSLAHLVLKELFACQLPPNLDCFEMFIDEDLFVPVPSVDEAQLGDLVWFGRISENPGFVFTPQYDQRGHLVNWGDHPLEHVAIATGESVEGAGPLLLHATHIEGTTAVWPLTRFLEQPRYAEIHGVSRLRIHDPATV
jgi:hypothetical protein